MTSQLTHICSVYGTEYLTHNGDYIFVEKLTSGYVDSSENRFRTPPLSSE